MFAFILIVKMIRHNRGSFKLPNKNVYKICNIRLLTPISLKYIYLCNNKSAVYKVAMVIDTALRCINKRRFTEDLIRVQKH